MFQNCVFGCQCVCDRYQPVSISVMELHDYILAQRVAVLSPLNVWGTGEEIGCDPRSLAEKEEDRLWTHFVKSGGAKRFAEATKRGEVSLTICACLLKKDEAA